MKDWVKFLKKLVLLCIALILLDRLIGAGFKHYYFQQKVGLFYRITYVINTTKADILVFGSSRADHHYVPSVFENKLHETFYNCGSDGYNLIYHAAVISAVLKRYTPKHVIIDLTPNELSQSEEGRLSQLLPYSDNPCIEPFIKYNGKFENYKLLSKMYPYNSSFITIAFNKFSSDKSRNGDKGFFKLTKVMPFHRKEVYVDDKIMETRIKILDDFLRELDAKHVKVTLVISPAYYSFIDPNDEGVAIEKLSHKYSNVRFFNYENNPAFADNKLFQDDLHLNYDGAYKFSEDLANKLTLIKE